MKNRVLRRLFAFISLLVSAVFSSAALPDCTPTQPGSPVQPFATDPAARQRQSDALRAMSLESIEYSFRGPIEQLRGNTGIMLPADIGHRTEGAPADDILRLFADILLANGTESLTVGNHREHYGWERSLMLTQSIRGIPVLQGVLAIGYDAATRRVTSVTATFVPDLDLPRTPRLSAKQAEQVVPKALAIAEEFDGSGIEFMDGTYLGYYADRYSPEPVQLVWVVQTGGGWEHEEFYVDAMTGIVAYRRPLSSSFVGRIRPLIEVTGARCECASKSISPPKPMRRLPGCGRLVATNWPQMPGVDRYVGQMALPELGWMFSDLVIDGSSPQCACEVPRTSLVRLRGCNSCGCGPWSKGQLIEVETPCPLPDDLSTQAKPAE